MSISLYQKKYRIMNMNINERIIAKTKELGISQVELAKRTGLTKGAVNQWFKGISAPNGENLLKTATALGVTPEWLQNGKESRQRIEPIQMIAANDDERVAQDGDEAMVLRALRQMTDEQRADILKNAQDIVDSNERLLTQLLARKKA